MQSKFGDWRLKYFRQFVKNQNGKFLASLDKIAKRIPFTLGVSLHKTLNFIMLRKFFWQFSKFSLKKIQIWNTKLAREAEKRESENLYLSTVIPKPRFYLNPAFFSPL